MIKEPHWRTRSLTVGVVAATLLLSGCSDSKKSGDAVDSSSSAPSVASSPSSSSSSAAPSSSSSSAESTTAPSSSASEAAPPSSSAPPKPVTLSFWLGGDVGSVNEYSKLAEKYTKEFPHVKIKTTFMGGELAPPVLLPALNAGTGPDIWQGGVGPGQAQSIINAGHTLDLTKYYFDLGWDKKIPEDVVTRTSSGGKLWGIGLSVQTTMMFYNKKIFADKGLAVPTTWSEFVAVEEALKKDYKTVVGLPAGDGWPISHNQTALWGLALGPEGTNNVLFGDGRWDDQAVVDATQVLVDQAKAGYFGKEPLAIGYRDNMAKFFAGEIPMNFTGTFFFPDWLDKVGDKIKDFGAFALPNPVEGKPIYPTESIAGAWYINAKSKNADEAAKFLDWLNFNPASRDDLLAAGQIPVGEVTGEGLAKLPVIHQEVLKLNDANRANGSVEAFFDTVIPANVATVTYDGLQSVLVGKTSAKDFNAAIQKAWEEAKAKGEIMKPGGVTKP